MCVCVCPFSKEVRPLRPFRSFGRPRPSVRTGRVTPPPPAPRDASSSGKTHAPPSVRTDVQHGVQ